MQDKVLKEAVGYALHGEANHEAVRSVSAPP